MSISIDKEWGELFCQCIVRGGGSRGWWLRRMEIGWRGCSISGIPGRLMIGNLTYHRRSLPTACSGFPASSYNPDPRLAGDERIVPASSELNTGYLGIVEKEKSAPAARS